MIKFILLTLFFSFFILFYSFFNILKIKKKKKDIKIKKISDYIENGAISFLKTEYKILIFSIFIFSFSLIVLGFFSSINYLFILSFFTGSVFSLFSGFIGMKISTKTNIRTVQFAKFSLINAFNISFLGRITIGSFITVFVILGLTLLFLFSLFRLSLYS